MEIGHALNASKSVQKVDVPMEYHKGADPMPDCGRIQCPTVSGFELHF